LFSLDEIESLVAQEVRLERFKSLDTTSSLNLAHTSSQTPSMHNVQLHSATATSSPISRHNYFQQGIGYRGRQGGQTGKGFIQCQVSSIQA